MKSESKATLKERESITISRISKRRQIVIPKEICDDLGLREGDFVEVRRAGKAAVIKPKRFADPDDMLTPKEAALVRKGERQLARRESVTLDEFESRLDSKARKGRRKTA